MSMTAPIHPAADSFSRHHVLTDTDINTNTATGIGTTAMAAPYTEIPYRSDHALSWGAILQVLPLARPCG